MMSRAFSRGWKLSILAGGLLLACTTTEAVPTRLCTPNQPSYCRCRDFQEGQKTCDATGEKFSACIPCETADNPEIPSETVGSRNDGGPDAAPIPTNGDGPCGDGIVNIGEDCDVPDGGAASGCSATCRITGPTPAATATCPGLDLHLWKDGQTPTLDSTTIGGGTHRTKDACGVNPTTGATGSDRVFRVIAHSTGTLRVVVSNATFNAFVWAAATCDDAVKALACANATNDPGGDTLALPVTEGRAYSVFVDGTGTGNNSGAFRVAFSLL